MPIALHSTLTRIFSLIFAFALFSNPATAQLTRAGAFERSSVDDAIPELVLAVTDPSTITGSVAAATAVATSPQTAAATPQPGTNQSAGGRRDGRGGGNNGPSMLEILVVGR